MNDEQLKVSRLLTSNPRFVWLPDLKLTNGFRVVSPTVAVSDPWPDVVPGETRPWLCDPSEWVLDLTSDATGGVLLGELGKGWRVARFEEWTVIEGRRTGTIRRTGSSLAEACARALLARWAREVAQ